MITTSATLQDQEKKLWCKHIITLKHVQMCSHCWSIGFGLSSQSHFIQILGTHRHETVATNWTWHEAWYTYMTSSHSPTGKGFCKSFESIGFQETSLIMPGTSVFCERNMLCIGLWASFQQKMFHLKLSDEIIWWRPCNSFNLMHISLSLVYSLSQKSSVTLVSVQMSFFKKLPHSTTITWGKKVWSCHV